MATRESIEMDFHMACSQADRVDEIADNLSNISSKQFGGTLQELSAGWKGSNASSYLNKGTRLQGKMNDTADDLHAIASEIRAIAKRIYDAEMAALEIAMARSYQ